ncbi:aldose 1-epimerase-like [Anneissia japonica]|uniref:aldose 1-epimerase-like n=1 Tax=Anneissia japonica TaxID=1529436 RepID=UPI0014255482|nr:aldose 1-epimerase-like [Anneissia japonica]
MASATTIGHTTYGKTKSGDEVLLYTFTNRNGMVMKVINFGAAITSINVPNAKGRLTDVVLGFDSIEGYESNPPYFGVTVGRVANRTEGGKFIIAGETYQLSINDSPRANHLHGGFKGFSKVVWKSEIKDDKVVLTYVSPDGEEGYPGQLTTHCTYQLTDDNAVVINFNATTTKSTPVNMCNHSYFNLSGKEKSSISDHSLMINADAYTPVKENLIPTGVLCPVQDTLFDFRHPVVIGDRLDDVGGFDHNFCLNSKQLSDCAARISHPSGLTMEVYTTKPGLQFYSANFLDGMVEGKNKLYYEKHGGLCLETQNYPNAVNVPTFPEVVLHPGQVYAHTTIFKFLSN